MEFLIQNNKIQRFNYRKLKKQNKIRRTEFYRRKHSKIQ